ncbi:MAG: Ig-like domain-containing protein [Planctomycetota bacterium]
MQRLASGLLVFVLAACGGSSGGSSNNTSPDQQSPLFGGLRAIATAGGASIRLDWRNAIDNDTDTNDIVYRVYRSDTSGAQDFSNPLATSGAGDTSILVAGTIGQEAFFVVRAVDGSGNSDTNRVELSVIPVAAANVAYVSDAAAGTGTLGDPTDPFPNIQDGVNAVEGAGGGVILVDAAPGGSTYNAEVDLTVNVPSIALFGGFGRLAGVAATDALGARDLDGNPTTLSGAGLVPMTDGDLLRVANGGTPTTVDGFVFDHTRSVESALTGTLRFEQGRNLVTGTGTDFPSELDAGDVIRLDPSGVTVEVVGILEDNLLSITSVYTDPTGEGSASLLGDTEHGFGATGSPVQLSGCTLRNGSTANIDSTPLARVVGNRIEQFGFDSVFVSGPISTIRFQNNESRRRSRALNGSSAPTEGEDEGDDDTINVPSTGLDILVTHNRLTDGVTNDNSGPYIDLRFDPVDPANGGDLTILTEYNEFSASFGEGVFFREIADLGANGSANVIVRHNLMNGVSRSPVEIRGQGETTYAGVDVSVEIYENELINSNSITVDIDLGVSAGRTTRSMIRDNLLAIGESESIELRDQEPEAEDLSDGGIMLHDCWRNVMLGGLEDAEYEVGVAHNGRTVITIAENTVLSSEDEGFNLDLEDHIGDTTQSYPFPDGVAIMRIFNNDVEAHDDEAFEIEDRRTSSDEFGRTAGIGYISHNFCHNGADPSDGSMRLQYRTDDGVWFLERNVFGFGGADTTESGLELETGSGDIRNLVRVRNNIALLSSGGGFTFSTSGSMAQLINNTSAYNAQEREGGFDRDSGGDSQARDGDAQVYILNCISSHSGGRDVDNRDGIRTVFSLIRDGTSMGFGNLAGEPFYEKDLNSIDVRGTTREFADLFSLQSSSPAIDAGHPASKYNDPDGSRNDMGAYGGPGAGAVGVVDIGTPIPFVYTGIFPAVDLFTGSLLVDDDATIWLAFSDPVDPASLSAISIRSGGVAVPGTFATTTGGFMVRFTPDTVLTPGASDFVEISIGTGLQNTDGRALAYASSVRFSVTPTATTAETEPNESIGAANAVTLGAAPASHDITGALADAVDVDVYAITVAAGDRIMATIVDARLGGGEDGETFLTLQDVDGERLNEGRRGVFNSTFSNFGDTYLDYTFREAGTFYLVVRRPEAASGGAYTVRVVLENE